MNFSLPNVVDDQLVSLADYKDHRAVAVIFSCNHCYYVVAYEDRIKHIHDTYAPQGIPVVAISSNDIVQYPQDAPDLMKRRAEDKGFGFPYLYDESQEIAKAFGAERTPHVFLLQYQDAGWTVLYKGAIDDNWQHPKEVKETYLADNIEAFLQEEKLPYADKPPVGCSIKWKRGEIG